MKTSHSNTSIIKHIKLYYTNTKLQIVEYSKQNKQNSIIFIYACVCVCTLVFDKGGHTFYNERYYKVKVTFWDIAHVPTFQKLFINHTEWVFGGESRNTQSSVRANFKCMVGVGQ